MASSGNEIERWTPRQGGRAGELVEPVTSPGSDHHLSPVQSVGSGDHPLPLPGRADSAYSSFSGASNVPEYPTLPCHGGCCCLPPEQVPYMDSEYVRGIYNLSAAPSDPRSLQPSRAPELGTHTSPHGTSATDRCGIAPARGTSDQGPLPSPPARLQSYNITRHLENSRGRHSSAGHREGSVQPAPGVQSRQLADRDVPWGQHWDGVTEQDTKPAKEKTLGNKGLSSESTNEVSVSKIQGLKAEENGEWNPPQQPTKRSNPHISIRPSSFIFQEYLKTDSVANVPKIISAYNSVHANKIPKEKNSKSYHPAHSNPKAVNDIQEVKQCPCRVNKLNVRETALQSTLPGPSQRKGSLACAQDLLCAEWHLDMDQDVFEDSCDLKYMENALLMKNASSKLNSCTDEKQCYDSEGKTGRDVKEPAVTQQARVQRPSLSCSCGAAETEQGRRQCCDNVSQKAFLRPREDSTSQLLCKVQKERQANNSSPDLSKCLEQEEPPVQKHQPEFQAQLSRQLWGACAEQITRQMTPMLYYLSGGKAPSTPQYPEGSRGSAKEVPLSSCSASAQCPEIPRERLHPQRPSHPHRCSADELLLHTRGLIPEGPASFTDESFTNDYREKLKVAQRKVLRETSFKRKDLQMSLPVRLRQKPSKRPSIEHLRSFSLSSASEGTIPVPCSPPHLQSLESFNRDEEIRRPQTRRVVGRKRVTKEEKKLCYSEPEKLDQLMDKEIWSQVRDEITEQDIVAARRRALENGGRALSTSSISRTELKQIQHSALMEYMERKISQRPGGSQHLPLQKPPLQKRLSHPKGSPGKISNPNGSRKMENDEVFCQVISKEKSPDALAFVPPLGVSSRCDPSKAQGSCTSNCPSAESLPQTGDPTSGRARDRSKPTPTSTQDRRASGAAAASQSCGSCASTPSFHDPERDRCKNHEHNDITGHTCCQDAEELTPESSVTTPGGGSKEGARVEEECRAHSLSGKAAPKHPEHLPAASAGQGVSLHTALAQPLQGDRGPAEGFTAQDDVPLGRGRLQSPQDLRYQELALEIIAKDSSLVDVLMPRPDRKTALDLMEGLFPVSISLLDKSHRKKHVQENEKNHGDGPEECPESEHEAKQRSKDPTSKENQVLNRSRDGKNDLDDITSKKLELMAGLRSRLRGLREQCTRLRSEGRECAERGRELEATLRDLCKPNEFERYLMFIGDLEKVVNLLLCLSSRLARVHNAMSRMGGSTDAEEKQSLSERHKLLSRQREDAKDLKENLDRRERVVSGILAKYLTEQQLQDYQHFVQVKTSLLIEQKDLEEQIKFFEEQLESLEQSIPL